MTNVNINGREYVPVDEMLKDGDSAILDFFKESTWRAQASPEGMIIRNKGDGGEIHLHPNSNGWFSLRDKGGKATALNAADNHSYIPLIIRPTQPPKQPPAPTTRSVLDAKKGDKLWYDGKSNYHYLKQFTEGEVTVAKNDHDGHQQLRINQRGIEWWIFNSEATKHLTYTKPQQPTQPKPTPLKTFRGLKDGDQIIYLGTGSGYANRFQPGTPLTYRNTTFNIRGPQRDGTTDYWCIDDKDAHHFTTINKLQHTTVNTPLNPHTLKTGDTIEALENLTGHNYPIKKGHRFKIMGTDVSSLPVWGKKVNAKGKEKEWVAAFNVDEIRSSFKLVEAKLKPSDLKQGDPIRCKKTLIGHTWTAEKNHIYYAGPHLNYGRNPKTAYTDLVKDRGEAYAKKPYYGVHMISVTPEELAEHFEKA